MSSWWKRAGDALLDWVYPPRCVICSMPDGWLCRDCEREIEFMPPPPNLPGAELLGAPLAVMNNLDAFRAVSYHQGVMRTLVHRVKYEGVRVLVPILGDIMYAYWNSCPLPIDLIVPVPLHPRRLRERGYNQSELLALSLAERMRLPLVSEALCRLKRTSPQVGLGARQRMSNVEGAFACHGEMIRGKRVLLIDDVCTSGATLAACSIALRQSAAATVSAFTLSRAVEEQSDL
jgi:competence protein ComFC